MRHRRRRRRRGPVPRVLGPPPGSCRAALHRRRAGLRRARAAIPVLASPARFAAKEAVLKALGVGIGAAGFRDVEVVRADERRARPGAVGRAAALSAGRGVRRWHVSLTHTDSWRWPPWWPRGDPATGRAVKPVLRVEEMRAVDAEALRTRLRGDPRGAGRHGRGHLGGAPAGRHLRPPRRGRGGQGQQRRRRPGGRGAAAPARRPGDGGRRRRRPGPHRPATDRRPRHRRRLRHRLPRHVPAPSVPRRRARARRRHPLGRRRRHRRGLRRAAARRCDRHLRGAQDRAPPGRRPPAGGSRGGGRHRPRREPGRRMSGDRGRRRGAGCSPRAPATPTSGSRRWRWWRDPRA